MAAPAGTTAVVIGAGTAGLLAARVLGDHVDLVTVVERAPFDPAHGVRRAVPRAQPSPVLLALGRDLLERWFPGLEGELRRRGAVAVDAAQVVWHQAGSYRVRATPGDLALSVTGALLERTLREQLLARCPGIRIEDGTAVDRLLVAGGRVVGVRTDRGDRPADLVVAASGRNTRFLEQLAGEGFPAPATSAVRIDLARGILAAPRRPDDLDGTLAVVVERPFPGHRMAVLAPVEADRWLVTLATFHGDPVPGEPREFEAALRTLPSPVIANVLARAGAAGPVLTTRTIDCRRRHVERLRRAPAGFVLLGDALGSVNPLFGQGTGIAALQAEALQRALLRDGPRSPDLVRHHHHGAAAALDRVWRIAAGGAFTDPRTSGPRPPGNALLNRYLRQAFLACHTSRPVADRALRVQALQAPPRTLTAPGTAARVLLAARRSPAARR